MQYKISNAFLSQDGLPGHNYKLDIGNSSIYIKTSWMNGTIVGIDITISNGSGDKKEDRLLDVTDLEMRLLDLAKCSIEESCRSATKLLSLGVDISEITAGWRGINGYPHGLCLQLQSIVPGPLHAAAVLIDSKIEDWRKFFMAV